MKNLSTVMRLARIIRRDAERFQIGSGVPSKNATLRGWCSITSNILFEELAHRGIRSQLMWNGSHCFLTYGCYLIDITATQFNKKLPKVVKRVRSKDTRAKSWWREENSEHTLAGRAKNHSWATSPSMFVDEWQNKIRGYLRELG